MSDMFFCLQSEMQEGQSKKGSRKTTEGDGNNPVRNEKGTGSDKVIIITMMYYLLMCSMF